MVDINEPLGQVQAFRSRYTFLDTNGVPTPGTGNTYVTDALVSLEASPVYSDGDHLEQKNGSGGICVNYDADDSLLRGEFSLVLCTEDPFLLKLLTGGRTLNWTGDAARPVGYGAPRLGPLTDRRLSIELWTKRVDEGELDDEYPYAWWVLPNTRKRREDKRTFGNNVIMPTITGKAYENANWWDGPDEKWLTTSLSWIQWAPAKISEVPASSVNYASVVAS